MTDLTKTQVENQIIEAKTVIKRLRAEAKERNSMANTLAQNNAMLRRNMKKRWGV